MPTHIYIIDDDNSVCKALVRFMRSAGFTAESFTGGESFLARHDLATDAVVISDIRMPRMNGPKIACELHDRGIDLPFVFITAVEDDTVIDDARLLGVAVLRKPVDGDELLGAVTDTGLRKDPNAGSRVQ